MVKEARRKIAGETSGVSPEAVTCAQADFPNIRAPEVIREAPFDAIVLVYDGVNYLTTSTAVTACLERMSELLRPGGIVVVDHATPANSEDNDAEFTDRGIVDGVSYVRHSRYDSATQQHHTVFEIVRGGRCIREEHIQQTYAPNEIRGCVDQSPLQEIAAYDGFTFNPADEDSHRVHWVLGLRIED
jgi:cyclopropane fatty-acyl-phospholipid synthase-like methyltransferase